MSRETVLLTGATGFLGSHLLEKLLSQGYDVVAMKRSTSNPWRIRPWMEQISFVNTDQQEPEEAFRDHAIAVVIHTATNYGRHGATFSRLVEDNLMFPLKILEAAFRHETRLFLNIGSLQPPHLTPYALTKEHFSDWLSHFAARHLQVIDLNVEHMYGPRDDTNKFIYWFLDQLHHGAPEIHLSPGMQHRDFIHVHDVAALCLMLLEKRGMLASHASFEVGTGEGVTVRRFLEELMTTYAAITGQTISSRLCFGARAYRCDEPMCTVAEIGPLMKLGWLPSIHWKEGARMVTEVFLKERHATGTS